MDKNFFTSPLRVVNSIRRKDASDYAGLAPVRTRGPLPTRSTVTMDKTQRLLIIDDLLQILRQQVGNMPLVILLHGWGSEQTDQFLNMLLPLVRDLDAVWLVPSSALKFQPPPHIPGRSKVLNLDKEIHRFTYSHLIGDINFFPALDPEEIELVAKFQRRARAVIVDNRGTQAEKVLTTGYDVGVMSYRWVDKRVLKIFDLANGAVDPSNPAPVSEKTRDEIGRVLKASARQLDNEYYRRPEFRALIEKVLAAYPPQDDWNRHLINEADKHEWPDWAITCLPPCIPLEFDSFGQERFFLWEFFLPVLEKYTSVNIEKKFCGGQIAQVAVSEQTAHLIRRIASAIEQKMSDVYYPSYRAVIGAVTDTLSQVELEMKKEEDPETAEKVDQAREKILQEKGVSFAAAEH